MVMVSFGETDILLYKTVFYFLELMKGEIKDGMSACDDFMTTTYKPIKEIRSSSK
jgi:hypothetical protein